MTTIDLPLVQDCSVSECSYNNNGCAAGAVTIGYGRTCSTFVPLSIRGGLERKSPVVGACQKADCSFNTYLVCTASALRGGSTRADCLTYPSRLTLRIAGGGPPEFRRATPLCLSLVEH